MMPRTTHVIGAGLAGLSAAVRLNGDGERVVVYEAAGQAGGRCRSYHDPALGSTIDNGNHLVLSGNFATLAYLRMTGAEATLTGPASADYAFVDLATAERWTLRLNDGRLPWWVLDRRRRVPGTRAVDYLPLTRLLWAAADKTVCEVVACEGMAYERLIKPLVVAALNTAPTEGCAALAGAVIRATMAAGGKASRPLIARDGLGATFIEPALRYFEARNVPVRFGQRLRAFSLAEARIAALDFGEQVIQLGDDDAVILAVPPVVAQSLVPSLTVPTEFRAIVNAHFRIDPPAGLAPMIGVLNATTEWIFSFPGRLSVTVSAADRLIEVPREELAHTIWQEVAVVTGLPETLPPWQIVRERRATFAATPAQNARRPGAATAWRNLFLAGDWTDTGLPATLESAIRSGDRAADLVRRTRHGMA